VPDLFKLKELAWHDCHGEVTPPKSSLTNMFSSSGGNLAPLSKAALVAGTDYRDLRIWAVRCGGGRLRHGAHR
jgi:hypothetical protein